MNVVHVLMNAVTEGTPDVLRDTIDASEEKTSGTTSAATSPPIVEHEPVVTPEEQVLSLLDAHDGRMWQQDVVEETGFSPAKVSRLLSRLEADGQIARYRKGRQKVVVDPDLLPPTLTTDG